MTEEILTISANSHMYAAGGKLYRPELDVVRFIAFFGVFVHHMAGDLSGYRFEHGIKAIQFAGGYGLCLFFVLSAFLISDLLMREREKSATVDIPAFFKRRILRIWPLYILGLLIGAVYGIWMHQAFGVRFIAYFLLAGNWYCVLYGWSSNPMNVLWSISIEEQFYLFWPWIARFASRQRMYVICTVLILVANGFLYYDGRIHVSDEVTHGRLSQSVIYWCNSFVQFQMFAAGILVALVLRQHLPVLSRWTRGSLLLIWPACWLSGGYFSNQTHSWLASSGFNFVASYALVTLGSVALLVGLLGVSANRIPRWLAYLGRISYGLYVYHMLALVITAEIFRHLHLEIVTNTPSLAQIVFAFAVTTSLAALSYRYFETPFLKRKPERI